jgi:RHS repeat-associated protein
MARSRLGIQATCRITGAAQIALLNLGAFIDNAATTRSAGYLHGVRAAEPMYYYRNRYYSPGTGRFVSEDPIRWASGQANANANGNPVSFTNPLGLSRGTVLTGGPLANL